MKDLPILFGPEMVRAHLSGRKTMTRRLLYTSGKWTYAAAFHRDYPPPTELLPPGRMWGLGKWAAVMPGNTRLWVRERTQCTAVRDGEIKVKYLADDHEPDVWLPFPDRLRFRPIVGACLSMGCYREASRITDTVTASKIERLQSITEADAMAEGWARMPMTHLSAIAAAEVHRDAARDWFMDLWQSLHGIASWKENPWVVALTFSVKNCNIDSIGEAA